MTENSISTWPCFLSISAQMLFVSTNMEECVGCVKHFVDQAPCYGRIPIAYASNLIGIYALAQK